MSVEQSLEPGLAQLAEGLRRVRVDTLEALARARSTRAVAAAIDRLLDLDRLLYEHALTTWRAQGSFAFNAFFRAAGSEFSREMMAMHSVWQRQQREPQ